ncbi:MAG: copper homeostasis protein CutC [Lachnospiraceae bacterium]|nr:copper homeostasis protein CutC [Lachnospiraceae bacterium]
MFDFSFDWHRELEMHIEILDYQHKQFFAIGREIEQLITTKCIGVTDEQLLKIVCGLRDYVAYHFYEEESMMQQMDYPELEQHRKEHQDGVRKVQEIDFHALKMNPLTGLRRIKEAMQQWSFLHMMVTDRRMAEYLLMRLPPGVETQKQKKSNRENFLLTAVMDNIDSAVRAVELGVDRIELCSNMIIGGTTPTLALFQEIRKRCDTKIDVVIRPRSGDYLYNATEFALMLAQIKLFKKEGADGIVIGALQPNGSLDYPQMQRMILTAGRMSVTLNRVMDVCSDPLQTIKEAGELGIKRVITSGQRASCLNGIDMLTRLMEAGKGKVRVMVNCGIDGNAIWKVYEHTGATAFRISGIVQRESRMIHRNMEVHAGIESFNEYITLVPDEKRIADAVAILNRI